VQGVDDETYLLLIFTEQGMTRPTDIASKTHLQLALSCHAVNRQHCGRRGIAAVLLTIGLLLLQACGEGESSGGSAGASAGPTAELMVHHWNHVAIDASGLDHTPVQPGETRVFGEQFGPTKASRAMAIVHIAIFDAVNAIAGGYQSYTGISPAPAGASMPAAIAQASRDTLTALFPSQASSFDQQLADDLGTMAVGTAKTDGIAVGHSAAQTILTLRANDGSQLSYPEPKIGPNAGDFHPGDQPGQWREDPVSLKTVALGANWGQVKPFVLQSASQFRIPPPPALDSTEYATAFDEVKSFGGDGIHTPTVRTQEQTNIGLYWAYDGTPSLCAPPRLYNQIIVHIVDQEGTDAVQMARLLALENVAMADAAIAVWESKYYYQFWRPVAGIREADSGTGGADPGAGPTLPGDGNPTTVADPTFMPLGAPASNLNPPNFTPPFPAYPSGHAGIGGAVFAVLRDFYGTDELPFTFVSDELNGTTKDADGSVRPLAPRSFTTFSQAAEENGQSRIYLGIHWAFDKDQGIAQGRQVGDYVFDNAFSPIR